MNEQQLREWNHYVAEMSDTATLWAETVLAVNAIVVAAREYVRMTGEAEWLRLVQLVGEAKL